MKKFFTFDTSEVEDVGRVGCQLDATHSPFVLLAMMSKPRTIDVAALAALATVFATGGGGGVTLCTDGGGGAVCCTGGGVGAVCCTGGAGGNTAA